MRIGRHLHFCGLLCVLASAGVALAQEPKAEPLVPSTFRSFIVTDQRTDIKDPLNRTNKLHCLVCENNLNPVIAVFARSVPGKADEPLSKLTAELKRLLGEEKNKAQNFAAFVVFVTLDKEFQSDDKRDDQAIAIKKWGETVAAGPVVLGLTGQTAEAVKNWNLNKDDDITVVLYNRMKVVQKPWTFESGKLGEADIKTIAAATEAELGKK